MARSYTYKRITDVADAAPRFGIGETQESRFATNDLDAEQTGFSHHRFKPGRRQGFGHRHDEAEEVYFVVSGSGRVKLDDDVIQLEPGHVIRVAPGVMRAWEAGPDGLEVLAFGPRRPDDRGEIVKDWWQG